MEEDDRNASVNQPLTVSETLEFGVKYAIKISCWMLLSASYTLGLM